MADTREAQDIFWVEPRRRGILPLDGFHMPSSMLKLLKQERFAHTCDTNFEGVIAACAEPAPGREQSWINPIIQDAYVQLHREGHAHSIETWTADGMLAGGLYGVRLGSAFFGESMFSRETGASKAALAHLVVRLRAGGFQLLDTQFLTPHLAGFGGTEVRRSQYVSLLKDALERSADWKALDVYVAGVGGASGASGAGDASDGGVAGLARRGFADGLEAPAAATAFGPSGKLIVQLLSQTS